MHRPVLTFRLAAQSLAVTLIALTAVMLATVTTSYLRGVRLLSVQSGSMAPAIQPGDALVVDTKVRASSLKPGDVVSYRSPTNNKVVISHRLVTINAKTGQLTTAGDALGSLDPAIAANMLIGRATARTPKLGLVLDALRRPAALALLVYLPALAIIATEIRRLGQVYRRPYYSVRL